MPRREELRGIEGNWRGTLEYLDYTTEKLTQIPVRVTITAKHGKPGSWEVAYFYTDEPQANTTEVLRIGKGGTVFLNGKVVTNTLAEAGTRTVTTQHPGKDNRRRAWLHETVVLSANQLVFRKEVQYTAQEPLFVRNQYTLERLP